MNNDPSKICRVFHTEVGLKNCHETEKAEFSIGCSRRPFPALYIVEDKSYSMSTSIFYDISGIDMVDETTKITTKQFCGTEKLQNRGYQPHQKVQKRSLLA